LLVEEFFKNKKLTSYLFVKVHHGIALFLDNVWFDASMQILLIEEITFYNLIVNWGQM
jgi:hypothetical protein